MHDYAHTTVLRTPTVDLLVTAPDGIYIDGTAGGGGHTAEILGRLGPGGRVIAFDADIRAIDVCRARFGDEVGARVVLVNRNFRELGAWLHEEKVTAVNGVLLDLGVSSFQFDANVGFSYRSDSPLDMRFHRSQSVSAADIVNGYSADDLARVLREYGEEPMAWRITQEIIRRRPLATTFDLRDAVTAVAPEQLLAKRLARVFQALRIEVNDELGALKIVLQDAVAALARGGRIAVIAYHSLEDRIVKDLFRYEALTCICPPELPVCSCGKEARLRVLTRKAVVPAEAEVSLNPRARSAKLRVAERI